jgi:thioredoxin reductase
MSDTPAVDIAIIGAGPVGLFAAFYAGLRQMSVKLVDSLEVLGGQLVTLYPEKYIYDVAGFPKVLAKDLAKNLIEQGLQYGATTHLGEQVLQIAFDASTRTFTLMTKKALHQAKSVLIATGIGAFQPKTLPLPNAAQLLNRGLHYFVREIAAFAGQRILIVGGGDSAVDWANMLSPIAAECTLIHRRDAFRAHEDSVAKMLAGKPRSCSSTSWMHWRATSACSGRSFMTTGANPSKLSKSITSWSTSASAIPSARSPTGVWSWSIPQSKWTA